MVIAENVLIIYFMFKNSQLASQLTESKSYKGIAVSNAVSIKLEKSMLYKNEGMGALKISK
jgi:hypothetical protein